MNDPQTPSRLDRLMRFLDADPRNPQLLSDALQLALAERDEARARSLLAHVNSHGAPSPEVAAHSALLHLQLGDAGAAARYGEQALENGLNDPSVRFNTAYAQLYTGNYGRVDELLAPLRNSDSPPELLVLHARALHHLEKYEDAKTALADVLRQRPDNAEALGMLALLEQEDDALEPAMELAQKALQLDAGQLEALLALAGCYQDQDNLPDARAWYQAAVEHHPTCGRAWSGLGVLAFSQFEFVTAEQYLLEAVKHMPDHIGTWHVLSWIYILQNEPAKARAALDKSYALDRSFADTHGGLAVVDVMEGKDEEARIGIKKAQRLDPNAMAARYAELLLLQKSGDTEAARQLVNTTLDQPAYEGGELRRDLVEKKLREMLALQARNNTKLH
jgi:tetratricopeptide (TPR) repeat protein